MEDRFVLLIPNSSLLRVEDVFVRIYYPDDRTISRRLVALKRERSLFPPAPKYQFADARSDRIKSDLRRALCLEVCIQSLYDQQLSRVKSIVLHCRNYAADYTCDLHS